MSDLFWRVESLIVCTVILVAMVFIYIKDEKARPYILAFLPAALSFTLFYLLSTFYRLGYRLLNVNLTTLSNWRIQVLIIPALIVAIIQAREAWNKSTGRK